MTRDSSNRRALAAILAAPKHRCENCGWWKPRLGFFRRLFAIGKNPGLGNCKNPRVEGSTWRTYVCELHTVGPGRALQEALAAKAVREEVFLKGDKP